MAATPQMKSIYDFDIGDIILMRGKGTDRIHAKVVGHGRSRLKVVQLEKDGKHPVGSVWTVKPSLGTPPKVEPKDVPDHVLAAADNEGDARAERESDRQSAKNQFRVGDRVRFVRKSGEVLQGTVTKKNRKSVSVQTDDQPEGRWWNIPPSMLEKTDVPKPEPPSDVTKLFACVDYLVGISDAYYLKPVQGKIAQAIKTKDVALLCEALEVK